MKLLYLWVLAFGVGSWAAAAPAPASADSSENPGSVRVHYHRPDGEYTGWGLHCWNNTTAEVTWNRPLPPTGRDAFGVFWDVPLKSDSGELGFIVHRGDDKDPGPDMVHDPRQGRAVWLLSGSARLHLAPPDLSRLVRGDLSQRRAHWVSRDLVLWGVPGGLDRRVQLHVSPDGGLQLTRDGVSGGRTLTLSPAPEGMPPDLHSRWPHLAGLAVWRLAAEDLAVVPDLLKFQLAVSLTDGSGQVLDASGVQVPGVLDDLFYYDGPLGVHWSGGVPDVYLWAPTARSVKLLLYSESESTEPVETVPMTARNGVWSAAGNSDWDRKFYRFAVEVFAPAAGRVMTNLVTDPYSRSLSRNSEKSQMVNLADPALTPADWDAVVKPPVSAPEDIVLYELHVRDFSASDPSVPAPLRGCFAAFTQESDGTRHLRELARSGVTHIHLLPVFDIATINEDKSTWREPDNLTVHGPASVKQQAAVAEVQSEDGYNWGYDPWHFGVPEGSYAVRPDGAHRILEFRRMVKALNGMGLRVVMDVVYNHTHASGQDSRSVLDRIVPGYYHRLSPEGAVETSTCCQNTASEHLMMERLMLDDLVHWAVNYKIDGFRFDLMGHHLKRNMTRIRERLNRLQVKTDGVDGKKIYLYGEGWDFGEMAGGRRGINASQPNMAGTGIGTFNDRIRDAIRGGNPFNDRREQGFATGLFVAPNAFHGDNPANRARLLETSDRLRIGLAGNLAAYPLLDYRGRPITGSEINYGGYTRDPQESINYASAHDNETLFDKITFAAAESATPRDRARMQWLALSCIAYAQGVPFFHAGSEMLRSKSLDADSYNSGDWFNRLDFSLNDNNFGVGLPIAEKNRDRWDIMRPLLSNPRFKPGPDLLRQSVQVTREILEVRRSSPLFRLRSAEDIIQRLTFHNTGPEQVPGLVVLSLSDEAGPDLDPRWEEVVVVLNARPAPVEFSARKLRGAYRLHPVQVGGRDPVVKTAEYSDARGFSVPGRTAAVFVRD